MELVTETVSLMRLITQGRPYRDMSRTPVQRAILVDLLVHGADKAKNIAERTGYHANSVSRSVSELVETGEVRNKGGGVYELMDSGRDGARGLIRGGYNPYTE
jgi:predicted transcriptional regulator